VSVSVSSHCVDRPWSKAVSAQIVALQGELCLEMAATATCGGCCRASWPVNVSQRSRDGGECAQCIFPGGEEVLDGWRNVGKVVVAVEINARVRVAPEWRCSSLNLKRYRQLSVMQGSVRHGCSDDLDAGSIMGKDVELAKADRAFSESSSLLPPPPESTRRRRQGCIQKQIIYKGHTTQAVVIHGTGWVGEDVPEGV
jgi:hypothetical protein